MLQLSSGADLCFMCVERDDGELKTEPVKLPGKLKRLNDGPILVTVRITRAPE